MHNLRLDRLDGRSIQQNFLVTSQHMDAEHYIRWLFPVDMFIEKDTSRSFSALRENYIVMADAGGTEPRVHWDLPTGLQWLQGQVETIIWYSGSTASTANFSLTLRAYKEKVGVNVTSMTAAFSAAQSMPGPAAAGDLLSVTRTQYLPITQEHPMSSWVLNRNVADANAGDLWIFAVRHRYIPDRHEV